MPETTANGYSNGGRIHNGYEMEDNASFLFTSESVGEGHPGENFAKLKIFHFFTAEEKFLEERSKDGNRVSFSYS